MWNDSVKQRKGQKPILDYTLASGPNLPEIAGHRDVRERGRHGRIASTRVFVASYAGINKSQCLQREKAGLKNAKEKTWNRRHTYCTTCYVKSLWTENLSTPSHGDWACTVLQQELVCWQIYRWHCKREGNCYTCTICIISVTTELNVLILSALKKINSWNLSL